MTSQIEELVGFSRELAERQNVAQDKRDSDRQSVILPVFVQPVQSVDGRFEPSGLAYQAVTRDVSTSGISLVQNQDNNSEYLGVTIQRPGADEINVAVRVVRCQPVGPYYVLAGRLVARIPTGTTTEEQQGSEAEEE